MAPWFDYDMTSYIPQGSVTMDYVFDEDYIDLCNADNPACVSGVTCDNCEDGFNPHLIVSSYLITTGDTPLDGSGSVGVQDLENQGAIPFVVYPNPASGEVQIEMIRSTHNVVWRIYNHMGQLVRTGQEEGEKTKFAIRLKGMPAGIYAIEVETKDRVASRKLLVRS
jgi:hypothetical protein